MKNALKKLVIALTLMLCATTTIVGTGAFLFYNEVGSDAGPIIRDFVIMLVAEAHEGDPVEFEFDISYAYVEIRRTSTNSQWLYEMVEEILPYLSYENVTLSPQMPLVIGIENYHGMWSTLHVAGWAVPKSRFMFINEWYIEERGLEEVLGTIIHELIHCQQGVYGEGSTTEVEAHTVAATLEVAAGMCLRGNEVACQTFWVEVDDLATRSFKSRMDKHGLGWLAELLQDIFMRDAEGRMRADKYDRHWKYDRYTQRQIWYDYGLYPWEKYVIPGINGVPMRHMDPVTCVYMGYHGQTSMGFDDTRELLGIWVFILGGSNDTGEKDG